jgi:hypothetical protein
MLPYTLPHAQALVSSLELDDIRRQRDAQAKPFF